MFDQDSTFEESPHDKDHPYVIVNSDLVRTTTLSPFCIWLIIYLKSNKKNWKIKASQIIAHVKGHKNCGRNLVYEAINELIEAGYMLRVEYFENNLKKFKYYLAENPIYSKKVSDIPEYGIPQSGTDKYYHPSSKEEVSKCASAPEAADASTSPTLSSPTSKEEEPKEVGAGVFLTPSQVESLKTHFKSLRIDYSCALDRYSIWKSTRRDKRPLNDFTMLKETVPKWLEEDRKKIPPDPSKENEVLARSIAAAHPRLDSRGEFVIGYKYVEFINGMHSVHVYYSDLGFRNVCESELRKRGLKMPA